MPGSKRTDGDATDPSPPSRSPLTESHETSRLFLFAISIAIACYVI
ncbi:MAG: hypothetical protein ACM37W_27085 [Actinomycetota bacterium]